MGAHLRESSSSPSCSSGDRSACEPGWQVMVTPPRSRGRSSRSSCARSRDAAPTRSSRLSFTDLERVPFETVWAERGAGGAAVGAGAERVRTRKRDRRPRASSSRRRTSTPAPTSRRAAPARTAYRGPRRRRHGRRHGQAGVSCPFPTQALAQEAGLTLDGYEDVLYAACLRDWDAEGERMRRYAERFDEAELVRIVGPETRPHALARGSHGEIDDGHGTCPAVSSSSRRSRTRPRA